MTGDQELTIVPGVRIGPVSLTDSEEYILQILGAYAVEWRELDGVRILRAGPYRVWFDRESGRALQITVGQGFRGCYLGRIGIGSTLRDVEQIAGPLRDEYDAYHLERAPGICFELEDIDDWDEWTAPIEFISVFSPTESWP